MAQPGTFTGLGATIGSAVPGVGTAIGAGVGGALDIGTLIAQGAAEKEQAIEEERRFNIQTGQSQAQIELEKEKLRRDAERRERFAQALANFSAAGGR